jgi:hypothetical protein
MGWIESIKKRGGPWVRLAIGAEILFWDAPLAVTSVGLDLTDDGYFASGDYADFDKLNYVEITSSAFALVGLVLVLTSLLTLISRNQQSHRSSPQGA